MKNKTIQFLFIAAALLLSNYSYSQINPKLYGDPEDYRAMAKRTMVVQLMEEDPAIIKKLSKKEKRAGQLKEYKEFISDYNELIQSTIPKYWTYNQKIEYKTETEVKELLEAKNKKYVLFAYVELNDSDFDPVERSHLTVPAFIYHRMESPMRKPDYKLYIPSSFVRTDHKYLECDFKVALQCMQNNIKWIIKNKKSLAFNNYAEEAAQSKCTKLKKDTLLLEKFFLNKMTEAEVKSVFGNNIEFTDADAVNAACVDTMKGRAILMSVPYGIAKGSFGPIASSALVFFKIVVDCETGDILWTNNPGSFPIGKNVSYQLMKQEFTNMKACKM